MKGGKGARRGQGRDGEENVHFFLDKIQSSVHGQHGLAAVLLQEHGTDQFINVRRRVERGEFLLLGCKDELRDSSTFFCDWMTRQSGVAEERIWGVGGGGGRRKGGLNFLHAEVLLLLGFEFLSGFDVGLKIGRAHV